MDDCIFCKIVRGDFGTTIVAENEYAIAFDDIAPIAPVHILVVPRKHISSLAATTDADAGLLAACMQLCREVAEAKGVATTGYRAGTNVGTDGGQSVFHLHFHVMGGRRMTGEG
jgi:histidine triad (HIT) family protein